jgi:hypothetical protein
MQTTKSGMTKRQALLTLLGAAPILAYGRQGDDIETRGFRIDATTTSKTSLLELNLIVTDANRPDILFLLVTINGKEEVRISIDEALRILKDDAPQGMDAVHVNGTYNTEKKP